MQLLTTAHRAAKPKLSLSVPTITTTSPKSPGAFAGQLSLTIPSSASSSSSTANPATVASSPSPLTPTARNTKLNQRGMGTLQVPNAGKGKGKSRVESKRVQFKDSPTVTLVSPMPRDCYGEWAGMSREERRWGVSVRSG